eukprot:3544741-Rhodomonas_salina.1
MHTHARDARDAYTRAHTNKSKQANKETSKQGNTTNKQHNKTNTGFQPQVSDHVEAVDGPEFPAHMGQHLAVDGQIS